MNNKGIITITRKNTFPPLVAKFTVNPTPIFLSTKTRLSSGL